MTPASSTPVVGYCRVSTEEQGDAGNGLDAQEEAIRRACDARGWILTDIRREVASGKTLAKRPVLREIIDELEGKGSGTRTLVVAKMDRLARSMLDYAAMVERSRKRGWNLVILEPNIDFDTPEGRAMGQMLMVWAEFERELISARTKAGMAQVKIKGTKTGNPIGRPRRISPETLERLKALRGSGLSYRAMADALNAEGLRGPQGGSWFQQSVRMACIRYNIKGGK